MSGNLNDSKYLLQLDGVSLAVAVIQDVVAQLQVSLAPVTSCRRCGDRMHMPARPAKFWLVLLHNCRVQVAAG
jgi:hypothetical protein